MGQCGTGKGASASMAGCGCRGKDYGAVRDDECPTEADLEQFGSMTRSCPSCKAELFDDVTACHACGADVEEAASKKSWWVLAVAAVVIGGFVLITVR